MPVFKTGSTGLSFTQQLLRQDPSKYVVGGLLTSYLPGTTTPLTGYKDANATLPYPNPIILQQDGRIPNIFFITAIDDVAVPYDSVRIRLTDAAGVLQFDFDNIPLLGPGVGSGGGGGGGGDTTDPNSVFITGDMKARYGVGTLTGWVRANGQTIGPVTSGATERSNPDTLALFLYLWNNDPNLIVTGGRGPTAQDDWDQGTKAISLPDYSGRALAFLDNMSGTPRGVLTAATFTALAPTVLGAQSGTERHVLALDELPVHDHPAFIDDPGHNHQPPAPDAAALFLTNLSTAATITITGGAVNLKGIASVTKVTNVRVKSASTPQGVGIDDKTGARGNGAQHLNVQPTKLCTLYIRL